MELAIVLSAFKLVITILILRSRKITLGILNKRLGSHERIARLPVSKLSPKIRKEVRIFNRMRIVCPTTSRIPNQFISYMAALYENPRYVPQFIDAYERVIYLASATTLRDLVQDDFMKKQLEKNALYAFVARNFVKREVSKARLSKSGRIFSAYYQSLFHFLAGERMAKVSDKGRFFPSYTIADGAKNYVDRYLPVECFEVNGNIFKHELELEKLSCKVTHTSDCIYVVGDGVAIAIYCPNVKSFGTNLAGCGENIEIVVNLGEQKQKFPSWTRGAGRNVNRRIINRRDARVSRADGVCDKLSSSIVDSSHTPPLAGYPSSLRGELDRKVFLVYGATKQETISTVHEIKARGNNLNYLLSREEQERHQKIANILQKAHIARFVTGEKLQQRFLETQRIVPTLRYPTLVYTLNAPSDFFFVVDNFDLFFEIARTKTNINIVFLYSSLHENMQNMIDAFSNREEARHLIERGIFIFFVDKATVSQDVVYYLTRMSKAKSKRMTFPITPTVANKNIIVEYEISKSFPVKHSCFLLNNSKNAQRATLQFPLDFEKPVFILKKDNRLHVTTPHGNESLYTLPNGAEVLTPSGKLKEAEVVADKIVVLVKTSLEGHQEKPIEIIKNEGVMSVKERRQAFLGSLENIKVKSSNALGGILARPVCSEEDCVLDGIKLAVKNLDEGLFYACFAGRDKISETVYAYILRKVIGIKLARGKISVAPIVAITGEFELSFQYKGTPFNFNIRMHKGGFAVKHNGQEYNNFLQVSV